MNVFFSRGRWMLNSDNHRLPNVINFIDIEKERVLERAQKRFNHTISPFGTFRATLNHDDQETTRSHVKLLFAFLYHAIMLSKY